MGTDQLRGAGAWRLLPPLGLAAAGLLTGSWIARAPAPAAALLVELPLLGLLALLWIWGRIEGEKERRFAYALFAGGLLLRVLVLFLVDAVVSPDTLAPDQVRFHYVARLLAEKWHGADVGNPAWLPAQPRSYDLICAGLYYFLGAEPLLPKILNAVASALSAVMVFALAVRCEAGRNASRLAGILAAVFPSLVLWSVLQVRDALAILALVMAFLGLFELRARWSLAPLIELVVGVLLLSFLRGYLTGLLVGALVLGWIAGTERTLTFRRLLAGVSLLVLTVIALRAFGYAEGWNDMGGLERLQGYRENLAVGGSAYEEGADISTLGGALLHLPRGVLYFLFAPFPWAITSNLQLAAVPETYLWYLLLPLIAVGLVWLWRRGSIAILPLVAFVSAVTASYSLVEGNVGTAYRHRAQVLIFFLIFAAVGLERLREHWRAGRLPLTPQPPATSPPGTAFR